MASPSDNLKNQPGGSSEPLKTGQLGKSGGYNRGNSPEEQLALDRQMGRDYRTQKQQGESTGSPYRPAGIRGRIGNALERSVDNYDSRRPLGGIRGQGGTGRNDSVTGPAEQRAARQKVGDAKAQAAQAAVQALAEGEGKEKAAEAAAAAVLEAKKIQQFRMILLAIRGGSAITVVGIIITILIWGIQLVVGHIGGREAWKMTKWELPIAIIIWALVVLALALVIGFWVLYMRILDIATLGTA